jgi:hypothetical protein
MWTIFPDVLKNQEPNGPDLFPNKLKCNFLTPAPKKGSFQEE